MGFFKENGGDTNLNTFCDWLVVFLKVATTIAGCHQLASWICAFVDSVTNGMAIANHSAFRGLLIFMFVWLLIAPTNTMNRYGYRLGWIFCWILLVISILLCCLYPFI